MIEKISLPTFLTETGIEKLFGSETQFIKAPSPIFLTLFGIVIFLSDEHPEKAYFPIFLTLLGIEIFVSDEHPEKAYFPIFLTL